MRGTLFEMIFFTVFVTSAVTMAFELAGARMLAPYLGTSIEVWAGVIGTILGGLSLGYWLGGKMADRFPRRDYLAGVIFLSGAFVAIAWALRDIIPALFVYLPIGSLTFTSFGIGILLFVPASTFFGAISPYAVKLSMNSLDASARTVGKLSAIGAIGSIFGTIATSSWIMPHIGTSALLGSIALILMVLSIVLVWNHMTLQRVIVGASLLFLAHGMSGAVSQSLGLLDDVDTAYGRAWIRESRDEQSGFAVRSIHIDPYGTQCASFINPDTTVRDELVFGYTKAFDIALAARPDADRLLMIGGCNYSYPRHALLLLPYAHIDVVEIDPGMTKIARKYFGLVDDDRIAIFHEDARTYLNRSEDTYDVLFTDAFNSGASVPYNLSTQEATQHAHDLLTNDGIFVANIIGALEGPNAAFAQAEITTIKSVFPAVRAFTIGSSAPDETRNLIVIASKKQDALDSPSISAFATTRADIELNEIALDSFPAGIILTDDFAPVESLTQAMRESYLQRSREDGV